MKAIVHTRYGPPEVLELREVPKPAPKADEVLIKIRATTVTSADWRLRGFNIPSKVLWLPARLFLGLFRPRQTILGAELAGDVEVVGAAVTRFRVGDPVFAHPGAKMGAYAEYICIREDGPVVHKPADVTYDEAAAVPFGACTALYYLRDLGNVRPGQNVLIFAASGTVGTYCVQIAKHLGATVTGVCSTRNLELVRSLGADHVIDYTQQDYATTGAAYDVIIDTIGKTSFAHARPVLKTPGVYLPVVLYGHDLLRMLLAAFSKGQIVRGGITPERKQDLLYLKDLIAAGGLKAVIDRRYPLEEIVAAHRYAETGRKRGNVVIAVTTES